MRSFTRPVLPILALSLFATLLVQGCSNVSQSNANPANWFDSEPVQTLEPEGGYTPTIIDNRPLVDQITAMNLDVTPGGVIVHAEGLPPRQEYWNAALVRIERDDVAEGTALFEFRLRPPLDQVLVGPPQSRKIQTAAFLSNSQLRGIRRIVVVGAQNSREIRR